MKLNEREIRGLKKYTLLLAEMVEPFIDEIEGEYERNSIKKFIEEMLAGYTSGKVEAPNVSYVLKVLLNMSNLRIIEFMSELRDVRHDFEDSTEERDREFFLEDGVG